MRFMFKRGVYRYSFLFVVFFTSSVSASQDLFEQTWTALDGLEQAMCEKFEQTWTILQDIDDTAVATENLFGEVNASIADTFTSLDEFLQDVCTKFEQTWTIFGELSQEIKDDLLTYFEQTWTALDEVEQALCSKFEDTATIFESPGGLYETLNTLITVIMLNRFGAQAAFEGFWEDLSAFEQQLCILFQETWTQFDGLSLELLDEFQATWTALNGLEQALCQKFADTGTILLETNLLLGDVDMSSGSLIASFAFNFEQTWTALDELGAVACKKFEDTWTILRGIEQQAGAIGQQEFQDTWTAIDEVDGALCDKFEDTWTILSAIDVQLGMLSSVAVNDAEITTQINNTLTALDQMDEELCDKFEGTWTQLGCFNQLVTSITGQSIISSPGVYRVENDFSVDPSNNGITIECDDVILDLNNKEITGILSGSTLGSGILVTADNNVQIRNGVIQGFLIGMTLSSVSKVLVEDICIRDSAREGMTFFSVSNSLIKNVTIERVAFSGGGEAVEILSCENLTISNMLLQRTGRHNLGFHAFEVVNSSRCLFQDIVINEPIFGNNGSISAFKFSGMTDSVVRRCAVCNVTDTQQGLDEFFSCFLLNSSSMGNLIQDCRVSVIEVPSNILGFDAEDSSSFNTFDRCVAQDIQGRFSRRRVFGFVSIAEGNLFNECIAQDIGLRANADAFSRECYGFYAFSNSATDRTVFKRCIAQRVHSTGTSATTTVAGFRMGGAADQAVFLDCQAVDNGNPNSAAVSYGFLDGGSNNAIYARCIASNNGSTLANQLGLGVATESDTWATTRAGLGAALPAAAEPFSSLGTTG